MPIKSLDWSLPEEEDAVTLAGFIVENLGRIPELGETVELYGIEFKVIMKRKQGITKLRATIIKSEVTEDDSSNNDNLNKENSENS